MATKSEKTAIEPLNVNLYREDWNLVVDKVNELVEFVNNK